MPKKPLNPQHLLAIQYHMDGASKADALRMAGYSESTASSMQNRVFGRPDVAAELDRRRRLLVEKAEVTEAWVIERLKDIANSGRVLAKYKKVTENGKLTWDFTGATEEDLRTINELTVTTKKMGGEEVVQYKIGVTDPRSALNDLARTLGLFKDSVEVKGDATILERLAAGRQRAKMKRQGDDAQAAADSGDPAGGAETNS